MKNLKSNVLMLVGLAGLLVWPSCSVQHKNDNELVVGTSTGFPPFEQLNDEGAVIGFDMDVAQKIAEKVGKKLVIKDMSFDALVVSLKQDKIDMILSGLSITKAKRAQIAMIHYQGKPLTSLPILFWQKIPAGVTTIANLENQPNKTVCAQIGTIQEEIISKYSFLNIKHLDTIADLILDIKHGKSIAAILEPAVVDVLQQQMPEIKILDLPLKQEEQDMGHGIGIKKENKKLVEDIEKAVQQLKTDGTLAKLEQKWFTGGIYGVQ